MIGLRYSLAAVLLFASNTVVTLANTSVTGGELQSCSSTGTALTGFTRSGYCVDFDNDNGSHNICIDLSSTTGGNFCDVTGQSNWCSDQKTCHDDATSQCPIQNWCVCEWAFASYIEKAGGCDMIQDLNCEAINSVVLTHYQQAIET